MFKIYTDGGSRGNPGPSGAGGVIINPEYKTVLELSEYLGIQTNNYAEYRALELTLNLALKYNILKVQVHCDSKLVVEQLNGNWKVKNQQLLIIYNSILTLIPKFTKITFEWLPRNLNKNADALANKAMDSITFYK
jgi:ribonuclease HI